MKKLFLSLGLCLAATAHAVVIDIGDGTGNTTAPADDFGFANIGRRADTAAVYLGNYGGDHWVLTTDHSTPGTVVLGGVSYTMVADSVVQMTNPDGFTNPVADLIMFRINGDPGLPNLQISTTPMASADHGTPIVFAGRGRQREEDLTYWNVVSGVWTEVSESDPHNATGYKTTSSQTIRWGDNTINSTGNLLSSQFGSRDPTTNYTWNVAFGSEQAQGVFGDSGGGAFYKDGDDWILAGINYAQGPFSGQPTHTAVFGNLTHFIDIGFYSDQILAVIPEARTTSLLAGAFLLAFLITLRQRKRS